MFSNADLLHGESSTLAAFLGTTRRTINRYKAGTLPLPEPARRLLRLRLTGDLSALLGDAWAGFSVGRDGLLYVPGWSNGMRPEQIVAMFFTNQEAAALRQDVRRLRADLWALRQVRRCYSLPLPVPSMSGAKPIPPARRSI
jgi:hypothetical protein